MGRKRFSKPAPLGDVKSAALLLLFRLDGEDVEGVPGAPAVAVGADVFEGEDAAAIPAGAADDDDTWKLLLPTGLPRFRFIPFRIAPKCAVDTSCTRLLNSMSHSTSRPERYATKSKAD